MTQIYVYFQVEYRWHTNCTVTYITSTWPHTLAAFSPLPSPSLNYIKESATYTVVVRYLFLDLMSACMWLQHLVLVLNSMQTTDVNQTTHIEQSTLSRALYYNDRSCSYRFLFHCRCIHDHFTIIFTIVLGYKIYA